METKLLSPKLGTMPRKPKRYTEKLEVRIEPDKYEALKSRASFKGFKSVSKFVRLLIDLELEHDVSSIKLGETRNPLKAQTVSLIEKKAKLELENQELKNRIKELERKLKELEAKTNETTTIETKESKTQEIKPKPSCFGKPIIGSETCRNCSWLEQCIDAKVRSSPL